MAKYKPRQFSLDDGKHVRYLNKNGKAEGIIRVAVDVGRNEMCICGKNIKYKNCCLKKGGFATNEIVNGSRITTLKIKLNRIFKKIKK